MQINRYKAQKIQKQKVFINLESDIILDKIAKYGIESLSKYEKDILEKKSRGVK